MIVAEVMVTGAESVLSFSQYAETPDELTEDRVLKIQMSKVTNRHKKLGAVRVLP